MRRRDVLRTLAGSATVVGLAGCLGDGGSTTPRPSPTDSGDHPVTPTERDFEVGARACGQGVNEAAVDVAGDRVTVEGTIPGRDGCDTAELAEVRLFEDELTVVVAVVEEATTVTTACVQCLTDIEYTFGATVAEEALERVRVIHETADGRSTVANVETP